MKDAAANRRDCAADPAPARAALPARGNAPPRRHSHTETSGSTPATASTGFNARAPGASAGPRRRPTGGANSRLSNVVPITMYLAKGLEGLSVF
jgi:hypothetical protein